LGTRESAVEPTTGRLTLEQGREGRYTGDGKDKSNERERQRERERERLG